MTIPLGAGIPSTPDTAPSNPTGPQFAYGGQPSTGLASPTTPIPLGTANPTTPAAAPQHLKFAYNTIGQQIPMTIGHGRLGLEVIWVEGDGSMDGVVRLPDNLQALTLAAADGTRTLQFAADTLPAWIVVGIGIQGSSAVGIQGGTKVTSVDIAAGTVGMSLPTLADLPVGTVVSFATTTVTSVDDTTIPTVIGLGGGSSAQDDNTVPAPTITFAGAISQPLDPLEDGDIVEFWDAGTQVYSIDDGGIVLPQGWTVTNQQQLAAALDSLIVFPGTEKQDPSPIIVADRGADVVSANRGLRYLIIRDYPIVGSGGTALPRLTIVWRRRNPLTPPDTSNNVTAVLFAAGSG